MLAYSCKKDNGDDNNPSALETIKDVDGNVYHIVTIGKQVWMKENLRTTKYRDGSPIPEVTNGTAWGNLTTGAYCNYNNTNNSDTIATYGRLYNWYAVNDSRNLAPSGWHVASDAEWTILTDSLGGYGIAGCKLKETGTAHWYRPNETATNESGFTALPGGQRNDFGKFDCIGGFGSGWSSTEFDTNYAWRLFLNSGNCNVGRNYSRKVYGTSVRCVRDI